MENENSHIDKANDDEILATARSRFKIGVEANSENMQKGMDDLKFRMGDQWDEKSKNDRALEGRPCLTINKIHGKLHQITNEERKNRPAVRVVPSDDQGDVDTAKIIQGLLRNIEKSSDADNAYDTAFDNAASIGRGFFRIITDYCNPYSFDQEARYVPIKDSNSVVIDPSYKKPDGSDANWCFVYEDVLKEDFKAEYPDSQATHDNFEWPESMRDWHSSEMVRVTEYFYKSFKADKLLRLPDDSTALLSEVRKLTDEQLENLIPNQDEENRVVITRELIDEIASSDHRTRDTKIPIVNWVKMVGNEILERTEFPARWIPVIPVHGVEMIVDGKRHFEGVIRHAKDAQKMYNYWITCQTEMIALAPKAPYIMAEGQDEGFESEWESAHVKNRPYLRYKPVLANDGTLAPPPSRNFANPDISAISHAAAVSDNDIKDTMSIYNASVGAQGNEISGRAINARINQSQTGNFHFSDNLRKSIRHGGRICLDIVQRLYDAERVIRITNEDDNDEIVKITNQFNPSENDQENIYNLSLGKYDVIIDIGPNFLTKREEGREGMISLSQHYPELVKYCGDLIVKAQDWPYAQEIAERLKKLLPPDILDNDKKQAIPPMVKAKMDEMTQMIEQLSVQLESASEEIKTKKMELESKERIEMAKIEKDLRIKEAELKVKEGATLEDLEVLASEILQVNEQQKMLLQYLKPELLLNDNENINTFPAGVEPGRGEMPETEILESE